MAPARARDDRRGAVFPVPGLERLSFALCPAKEKGDWLPALLSSGISPNAWVAGCLSPFSVRQPIGNRSGSRCGGGRRHPSAELSRFHFNPCPPGVAPHGRPEARLP